MKQLAQYQDGRLELQEVPSPMPPPGGILVRTTCSVISPGTEKMKVEQARMSLLAKAKARPDQVRKVLDTARTLGWKAAIEKVRNRLETPTPLGYSLAGVVVAVDEANPRFRVGDRVACGGAECANHAEMVAIPDLLAAKIPDGVEDWQAAYTTLCSISLEAVRQSGAALGERVLVMGQGLVGLLATGLLKAAGVRVMASDLAPSRLSTAQAMGAERVVNPAESSLEDEVRHWTEGHGVDAVLVCVGGGGKAVADAAINALRDRGVMVIVGMHDAELTWKTAYLKDIQVRYSRSYGPGRYDPQYEWAGRDYPIGHVRWTENRNFEACLQLMSTGALDLQPVTTRRAAFTDAFKVYQDLLQPGNTDIGVVLEYQTTVSSGRLLVDERREQSDIGTSEADIPINDPRGPSLDARKALETAADDFRRDSRSVRAQPPVETLRGRTAQIRQDLNELAHRVPPFDMSRVISVMDTGGEHDIYEAADTPSRVYKITRPNLSGLYVLACRVMGGGVRVTTDDGLPLEYLARMYWHNVVFGDDIQLEGMLHTSSGLHLVVSQPLIEGTLPQRTSVHSYLSQLGFEATADGYHWYRTQDGIALADTKPANFIEDTEGVIHPIDVIVFRPSDAVLHAWGLDQGSCTSDIPPSSQTTGKPPVLHVVGAGNFVRTMLLPKLQCQLPFGTICNATGLSSRQAKEKFGFASATTDSAEVFSSAHSGEAVLIGTRHHLHAPMVLLALQQHHHVFVEKPLCLSLHELAEIDQAQAKSQGSVMVGFNRRFAPATSAVRSILQSLPGPKTLSYHVFAGPLAPDHWYSNLEESGGRILGEGCHFLDFACHLLGESPLRVAAQPLGTDSFTAQVEFSEGSSFQLIYSAEGDYSFPKETFRVFASGTVIECVNFMKLTRFHNRSSAVEKFQSKGHAEEMAAWVAYLKGTAAHPLPYSEARTSMNLTFSVLQAIRERRLVEVVTPQPNP